MRRRSLNPFEHVVILAFDLPPGFEVRTAATGSKSAQVATVSNSGSDIAEITMIPRAPSDCETTEAQFMRLLQAHEMILLQARAMARTTPKSGDLGTNDLMCPM
jgi:hypothetical protein